MRLPDRAPSFAALMARPELSETLPRVLSEVASPLVGGRYVHWDDLRRRTPPGGLTSEEWWLGIVAARQRLRFMGCPGMLSVSLPSR